jgi:aldose sugar dehydrogenase
MGPTKISSASHYTWFTLVIALVLSLAACGGGGGSTTASGGSGGNGGGSGGGSGGGNGGGSGGSSPVQLTTETVVSGLTVPWALAFAPDGRLFFTEQPGRLRIFQNGKLSTALDYTNIVPGGESGMLGLALDPNFASNHTLYICYCADQNGRKCRVSSFIESNNSVAGTERILLEYPGTLSHHAAGRIMIHDDLLYVTVGDLSDPPLAQDKSSFAGKILRMTLQGAPAPGNPFTENPYVYSYGHRDPQGLAFDSSGALYSTEHGPTSNDEVNLITAGGNYGWPTCVGKCGNAAFIDPVRLWTPETLAPSGATFYNSNVIPQWNGSMLIGSLGLPDNTYAHHIHRLKFDKPGGTTIVEDEVLYRDQFGRIRDVEQGPDGFVYFSTSGGGGADKIVRIKPK